MSNLRDYYNKVTNDGRIFSLKDVMDIPAEEDAHYKDALDYQAGKIGFPTDSELSSSDDVVYVHSYSRDDGTKVRAHYRSKNGHSFSDPNRKPLGTPTEAKADLDARIDKWMRGISQENSLIETEIDNFVNSRNINVDSNSQHKDYSENLQRKLGTDFSMPWLPHKYYRIALTKGTSLKEDKEHLYCKVGALTPELESHIKQMSANIKDNTMVVVPDENSGLVRKVKKSNEIKNLILKNSQNIINGDMKNKSSEVFAFNPHSSLGLTLGHSHIYDVKFDKDKNLVFKIIDLYDFSKMNRDSVIARINNNAYKQQEKGYLMNYVICADVKYTPEEYAISNNGIYIK